MKIDKNSAVANFAATAAGALFMQNGYAGDIGDFGKFGFLHALEKEDLSVGVNWYLSYPEGMERALRDGKYRISSIMN